MSTTLAEFKEGVLSLYKEKKRNNELDDLLLNPSPANLRDYCLVRLSEGLPQTDIEFLQKFFNPYKKEKCLEDAIARFNSGGLKASQKFILGKTENPEDRVIKLLAILVDYQPRPFRYNYDKKAHCDDDSNIESGSTIEDNPAVVPTETEPLKFRPEINFDKTKGQATETIDKTPPQKIHVGKYAVLLIGTIFVLTIIFLVLRNFTSGDCMSWNGDRYIQVNCQDKSQTYQVIGLDKEKLDYFQRITQQDTLGLKDVGRVWYSKIDNEVEFFTRPGFHPAKHNRSLKLATEYIIEKYAGKSKEGIERKLDDSNSMTSP